MILRPAAFAVLLLTASSANAAMCVVDPETLKIRDHLLKSDNQYLVPDQTGATLDWVINAEPLFDHERRYEKYALPRAVAAGQMELQGWVGAVPLLKAAGDAEVPEVVYLLVDPGKCEVQPYQVVP